MPKNSSIAPLTDYMMMKASGMRIPLSGTFELTPLCNFDCKMCYVRKSTEDVARHHRKQLSFEQWISIAEEAKNEGMLFLLLTGGEPLSWPQFWRLYEELIRMGLLISINTNGSLIDDDAIARFRKLPPKRINITLYGASNETYEHLCQTKKMYDKVIHAIKGLKEAGISVKINCSLTPYNVQDLEEIVHFSQDEDIPLSVVSYMFPPLRKNESMVGYNAGRFSPKEAAKYRMKTYYLQNGGQQYKNYLEAILKGYVPPPGLDEYCEDPMDGKIRCRAGKAAFWITWDGWNVPCGMMTEPRVELVGRSFTESWKDLVNVSADLRLSGVCSKCSNQDLCHACAAMALSETGTVSGIPKYLCEMVDAMKELAQEELQQLETAE